MGRVETRMYKRRQHRARVFRGIVLLLLLLAAILLAVFRMPRGFISELIAAPTPTPLTSAYDQTVESREVTLAEETWYAIQTGVFSTREAAVQKAEAYTRRGAPGTVVEDGAKWRVFIACYGAEAEAASVRTRLSQSQGVDTYLYPCSSPPHRRCGTPRRRWMRLSSPTPKPNPPSPPWTGKSPCGRKPCAAGLASRFRRC